MTNEELKVLGEMDRLGYANVYKKGESTQYIFSLTAENIASFIEENSREEKVIITDFGDQLIVESIRGGFIMNCPEQEFCKEILQYLIPIQEGDAEVKEILIATSVELEAFWEAEELEMEMDMGQTMKI